MLAEPARLRVLALAAAEELSIGELADVLEESQPNVSRYTGPLRQAGLLAVRKEGTRTFVSLREGATADAVVADAVASGRALCEADGSLRRVAQTVRARDAAGREFFARASGAGEGGEGAAAPAELGAYLAALGALLPRRDLAVDAGTGDGGLLEVLSPVFRRVVAIDRSEARLARARERIQTRGLDNVTLVGAELGSETVRRATRERGREGGADAVFASRILHHAARPADVVGELSALLRPGGTLVVIDYERHEDESMRSQADLWLGFGHGELERLARAAGLEVLALSRVPPSHRGRGPDAHLPWQILAARAASSPGHTDAKEHTNDQDREEKRSRPRRQKGSHHGRR